MARGLAAVVATEALTVVVNVGDDAEMYGAHVSADLDTVTYTLAGIEGPEGWGVRDDTFRTLEGLAAIGVDTAFRLGDRDLATCLARTTAMRAGTTLTEFTARLTSGLGIAARILPATDDRLRTRVHTGDGEWLDFQEYFVIRGHRDPVAGIRYDGADSALPGPGVIASIDDADLVVIAPSNPPLSIWPILAVPGVRDAVAAHDRVVAVSPLIGGRALRGPADRVMASLGLPPGNAGVAAAYDGLVDHLVVDSSDAVDIALGGDGLEVVATDTRIPTAAAAARLADEILAIGGE